MKNWIEDYTNKSGNVRKYQEGGTGPAAGAPQGGDPAAQLEQMLAQYAQTKDPQLAVAIADMLVQAMAQAQQQQQGGGAGAPQGPPAEGGGAPPMAKRGMRVPGGPIFKRK